MGSRNGLLASGAPAIRQLCSLDAAVYRTVCDARRPAPDGLTSGWDALAGAPDANKPFLEPMLAKLETNPTSNN